jgi:hypothetical protein
VAERKIDIDHAATVVLPEHLRPDRVDALAGAAAEAQSRYQEYVRSLEELPVLVDVVREPPRVAIKDFRLGQRRDERKAPRGDAAELREQHERDLARQYAEYAELDSNGGSTQRSGPRQALEKNPRKSAAQKKRAKRAKRSARSKS